EPPSAVRADLAKCDWRHQAGWGISTGVYARDGTHEMPILAICARRAPLRRACLCGPGIRTFFHPPIVRVQFRAQEDQRGDTTYHVADISDLIARKRPAQDRLLPVRQPFFQNLVAPHGVFPCASRYILPKGVVIEEHIHRVGSQELMPGVSERLRLLG